MKTALGPGADHFSGTVKSCAPDQQRDVVGPHLLPPLFTRKTTATAAPAAVLSGLPIVCFFIYLTRAYMTENKFNGV